MAHKSKSINRLHIAPKTGAAFTVEKGQTVRVVDLEGGQVADLYCCSQDGSGDTLSAGHTTDYNGNLFFSKGDVLYSNHSRPMFTITEDRVGRHIMLYAPCSQAMYAKSYGVTEPHPNCFDNLSASLKNFGVLLPATAVPLNLFMNIEINAAGEICIRPPRSQAGDFLELRAEMDLTVAVSACPAGLCNNYEWTPVEVLISNQ